MHCWVGTVRGVVARDVYIYIYIMENIKKKKKEGKVIKYMYVLYVHVCTVCTYYMCRIGTPPPPPYTLRRYIIGRPTLTSVGVCMYIHSGALYICGVLMYRYICK